MIKIDYKAFGGGQNGEPGVGIASIQLTAQNALVVTYTNGTVQTLPNFNVVLPSFTYVTGGQIRESDNHIILTLNDGSEIDVGELPAGDGGTGIGQQGPPGDPGPPGEPGQIGPSIQNPQIDQNGDLTVDLYLEGGTYSNTVNLGRVVAPPGEPGQDFEWKDIDDTTFYGYWQNGALTPSLYYAVTVNNQFTVLVHPKNVSGQFQPAIKYDLANDYSYGIYDIDSRIFTPQGGIGVAGGPPILQRSGAEFAANTYPAGFTQGWCTVDDTNGNRYYYIYDDEATAWPAINNTTKQTGTIAIDDPIGFEPHQWVKEVTLAQTGAGAQLLQLATTTDAQGNSTKAFSAKALNSSSPNLGISTTSAQIDLVPNEYIAGKAAINISAVAAGTDIELPWYLTALAGNSRPSSLEFRWEGPTDGLNGNNSWVTNSLAILQLVMKYTGAVAPGMGEQILCQPFELGPIGPTANALLNLTQAVRTFNHPTGGSQTVAKTYTAFNGGTASQAYLCLRVVQPSTVPGTVITCLVRGVF